MIRSFILLACLGLLSSCGTRFPNSTGSTQAEQYQNAIANAMSPEPDKIVRNLIPITRSNSYLTWKNFDGEDYVLVVSWKGNDSIYRPYLDSAFFPTQKWPIWISASPELKMRMESETYADTNLRLLQLLGLPPNASYNYFIEFWVRPKDLFRPCPDAEITDQQCALCFPKSATQAHQDWINGNRISRYYNCELYDKYPWTQLGYTYDWDPANPRHVGLSEFVIGPNAFIKVNAIYTTQEYLR